MPGGHSHNHPFDGANGLNAVEIEEAVSKLVEEPFNAAEFSYAFLEAFGKQDCDTSATT